VAWTQAVERLARPLRVWSLSTGEAGSRQQARGLATELAVGLSAHHEEHVVEVGRLAALAPPALFSLTLGGVRAVEGDLAPPWPDVLVSCGRRASLAAMAIRRRARAPMALIHIQPPSAPTAFDLVVAMPHDHLQGRNVITVDTALHSLRASALTAAAAGSDARFAALPRPWTAVLLGGSTAHAPFSLEHAQRLADGLDALRARTGGSLLITASRRTPDNVIAAIGARYLGDLATFFWDGGGANPYLSILASADAIVVTSDSISMVSEALATPAEVWLFDVGAGHRHTHFVEALLAKRLAAWLGDPSAGARSPIDPTPQVAAIARDLIDAKLGLKV
jgi:hypothetical protein